MEDTEVRYLDTGRRMRDFGTTNVTTFPANTRGGELFVLVGAKVAELEAHAAEQAAAKMSLQESTAIKDAIRVRLKGRLKTINLLARGMSKSHPGIREKFRMPRGGRSGDAQCGTRLRDRGDAPRSRICPARDARDLSRGLLSRHTKL